MGCSHDLVKSDINNHCVPHALLLALYVLLRAVFCFFLRVGGVCVGFRQRDKWRRTPLHRAAKEGHKETVAALLDSGAEINAQVSTVLLPWCRIYFAKPANSTPGSGGGLSVML